jgi:hypothetical protein
LWPLAISGTNGVNESRTAYSMSIGLNLYDMNGYKIEIRNGTEIELWIPRDPVLNEPPRDLVIIGSENSSEFRTIYFDAYVYNASICLNLYPKSSSNLSFLVLVNFMDSEKQEKSTYHFTSTLITKGMNERLILWLNRTQLNGYQGKISFRIKEIIYDMNETNSLNQTYNYEYYIYAVGCFRFDEINYKWSSYGMEIMNDSNYEYIHCKSNQLGTFAGGYSDSYSLINEVVLTKNEINDSYITVVSSSILATFVLLFLWAGYKDVFDSDKVGITNLDDNDLSDKYKYKITIFTGEKSNSQTDSNVIMAIYGDLDEIGPRVLLDSKRKLFRCGSVDCFILATNKSIGNIDYIKIWHDNTGKGNSASWYLDNLVVDDFQTNKKYYFNCEKWLAVEKDDFKLERILIPKGSTKKSNFLNFIKDNAKEILRDSVLPTSIFYKPIISMFLRVERVACFYLVLSIAIFCITISPNTNIIGNQFKRSILKLDSYDVLDEHVGY